jgi:protein ImuA
MPVSALNPTVHLGLESLHADVWHADALARAPARVLATGDALLNAELPGGGWPVGALTEILQAPGVHNEWRLLLPALVHSGQGPVVLVGAPHVPFAPALAAQGLLTPRLLWVTTPLPPTRLWATEQALRCAEVDAVLAWLPQARSDQLRRLQMAAAEHAKLLFVMRPAHALHDASPAVLRLWIGLQGQASTATPACASSLGDRLEVQVLKRRGPPLAHALHLQARSSRLSILLATQPLPAGAHFNTDSHALDRAAAAA